MKKFAMLGKWHVHAEQYANELSQLPGCRVAKVWDPDADVAVAWAKALGCEAAALQDILKDPEIEGVVIATATNEHTDLIQRCCNAGKAVFTEKVLDLTNEGAEAIRRAVFDNHTRFAISFPHLSDPAIQCTLEIAKSGKLGKINYARFRKAHNGATADWLPPHFYDALVCGGGAMIDLGAHPMYLLCEVLGEPKAVKSVFTHVTGRAVEDNAVSLIEFEDGAIGVSETGFVSKEYPLVFEIGGVDGTLIMAGDEVRYNCPETNGQWTIAKLPKRKPSPLAQWALSEAPEGIPESFNIDAAVRLTRIMVMAYQSK